MLKSVLWSDVVLKKTNKLKKKKNKKWKNKIKYEKGSICKKTQHIRIVDKMQQISDSFLFFFLISCINPIFTHTNLNFTSKTLFNNTSNEIIISQKHAFLINCCFDSCNLFWLNWTFIKFSVNRCNVAYFIKHYSSAGCKNKSLLHCRSGLQQVGQCERLWSVHVCVCACVFNLEKAVAPLCGLLV